MKNIKNFPIGKKFGKWVTLHNPEKIGKNYCIRCKCACGIIKDVRIGTLVSGESKGCFRCGHFKHGMAKRNNLRNSEYSAWMDMHGRCNNKNHPSYRVYGGRGIRISRRWHDFIKFISDMGKKPSRKYSLDRIDVNGDYEIHNCRWATRDTQDNNRQNTKKLSYLDQTKSYSQWEKSCGLSHGVLWHRLSNGWSIEKSLKTPVRFKSKDKIS